MDGEPGTKIRAARLTFSLRQMFPCEDSLSVPLLRLMAATNDTRFVMELSLPLLVMTKTPSANDFETSIINGKLLYLFRLLCSHLYEAGRSFRDLDNARRDLLDNVVREHPKTRKYLAKIRDNFSTSSDGALHYSFLGPVRHRIGFHYKSEPMTSMLRKHNEADDLKGSTIIAQYDGLSRHIVSDLLATEIVHEVLGGNPQEFERSFYEKMGEVVDLAGQLSNLVDRIVIYLVNERESAILEDIDGDIPLSQEFGGLVEQLMKERNNQL
jgi:hypothetical protein